MGLAKRLVTSDRVGTVARCLGSRSLQAATGLCAPSGAALSNSPSASGSSGSVCHQPSSGGFGAAGRRFWGTVASEGSGQGPAGFKDYASQGSHGVPRGSCAMPGAAPLHMSVAACASWALASSSAALFYPASGIPSATSIPLGGELRGVGVHVRNHASLNMAAVGSAGDTSAGGSTNVAMQAGARVDDTEAAGSAEEDDPVIRASALPSSSEGFSARDNASPSPPSPLSSSPSSPATTGAGVTGGVEGEGVPEGSSMVQEAGQPVACGQVDKDEAAYLPKEVNGPRGPEPTRYGDWEKGGRCFDF